MLVARHGFTRRGRKRGSTDRDGVAREAAGEVVCEAQSHGCDRGCRNVRDKRRREELTRLLEGFERWATWLQALRVRSDAGRSQPVRALFSEWESQEALDAHYRSDALADFQLCSTALLARPSELTVYSIQSAVRPTDTRPMDPRDAD
jgi:quinol monooxygenase YgiN